MPRVSVSQNSTGAMRSGGGSSTTMQGQKRGVYRRRKANNNAGKGLHSNTDNAGATDSSGFRGLRSGCTSATPSGIDLLYASSSSSSGEEHDFRSTSRLARFLNSSASVFCDSSEDDAGAANGDHVTASNDSRVSSKQQGQQLIAEHNTADTKLTNNTTINEKRSGKENNNFPSSAEKKDGGGDDQNLNEATMKGNSCNNGKRNVSFTNCGVLKANSQFTGQPLNAADRFSGQQQNCYSKSVAKGWTVLPLRKSSQQQVKVSTRKKIIRKKSVLSPPSGISPAQNDLGNACAGKTDNLKTKSSSEAIPPECQTPLKIGNRNKNLRHRAVCIDTRVIQAYPQEAAGRVFLSESLAFLQSAARRGALPAILATPMSLTKRTCSRSKYNECHESSGFGQNEHNNPMIPNTDSERFTVRATSLLTEVLTGWNIGKSTNVRNDHSGSKSSSSVVREEEEWERLLPPVPIHVSATERTEISSHSAQDNIVTGGGVHVTPISQRLTAHSSWLLFADLVDCAVAEADRVHSKRTFAKSSSSESTPKAALADNHRLDVTIMTSDLALLSDSIELSHRQSISQFFDRVKSASDLGKVNRVDIIICETGIDDTLTTLQSSLAICSDEQEEHKTDRRVAIAEDPNSSYEGPVGHDGKDCLNATAAFTVSPCDTTAIKFMKCVRSIKSTFLSLQGNESTRNQEKTHIPSIKLELMDCGSLGYKALLRRWVQDIIGTSRISFQLPETMDGTVCSIDLDLQYTVFPTHIHSAEAKCFQHAIEKLTTCNFSISQIVPNANIDASMIFGIPMTAKAGLESDIRKHQEMKTLVQQLWRWLGTNDSSLLLRAEFGSSEGESLRYEYLLLMTAVPEATPENSVSSQFDSFEGKTDGILFRYAHDEQILTSSRNVLDLNRDSEEKDDEEKDAYFECIERSLELVDRNDVNPILLPAVSCVSNVKQSTTLGLGKIVSATFAH